MTLEQICIIIAIAIYLSAMIFIGFYFSKKGSAESGDDFYLGGRTLGPIVTAMSAEASDMSSWLLMGLPGLAYLSGIADAGWTAIGLAVGTYFNWLIVAKRLRNYSHVSDNAITIPSFFSARYRDKFKILTCISAIFILIFFIPYTASGFKAIGTLFNSLFGFDYHVAMIIGAIIIIGYTALGGFLAVSVTDLVQSIVMSFALILILFFAISSAGGLDTVITNSKALDGYLSMTHMHVDGASVPYKFLSIASALAWGLGYFGMPHILLRFMAISDASKLRTSRRIATIWVVISMCAAIFIGIIGYSVSLNEKIQLFSSSSDSETIIIKLAELLSKNGVILALFAGIVIAGIIASTMSTSDSQLLTAASSVSENLIQDFFRIKLDAKKSMVVARSTVVIIAAISVILAWNPNSSVFQIVSFAWAGFGAVFGPVMLFALFWKRSNLAGAFAGMLSGGIMVFVWKFLVKPLGGAFGIYELLPSFIVASIVIVIVSLCTKAPSQEIYDEFDKVKAM